MKPEQSSRKFSGLPLRRNPIGLWYTSLGFPKRDISSRHSDVLTVCGLVNVPPRDPFNQRATGFPAAGYRNNSSGAAANVGTNGNYWSASPNSTTNGRNLNFNSSKWNWNNNNRSNGYSVRAVVEAFEGQWALPFFITLTFHQRNGYL